MNLPLNTDLTGKVAVVTGAAGTLCSVFSKALAASGAKGVSIDSGNTRGIEFQGDRGPQSPQSAR